MGVVGLEEDVGEVEVNVKIGVQSLPANKLMRGKLVTMEQGARRHTKPRGRKLRVCSRWQGFNYFFLAGRIVSMVYYLENKASWFPFDYSP